MILEAALICLATNIWHEARGEPILGQYAVAQVTLNRAGHDQSRVCRTVYAPRQFSWTHQRVRHKDPAKVDPDAWERAKTIARVTLERPQLMNVLARDANHYHAHYVSPRWKKRMTRVAHIGKHIFYYHA